jgi:GDPmannose 4,6-dehydratase
MLQQQKPDDYIIATGEAHSLREFVEMTFSTLNLHWQNHVVFDKKLRRPSDIATIYGDASKAETKLGWDYQISFTDLVSALLEEELRYCDSAVA